MFQEENILFKKVKQHYLCKRYPNSLKSMSNFILLNNLFSAKALVMNLKIQHFAPPPLQMDEIASLTS